MRGLIAPDSKLASLLTKMVLLAELNLLVLLCCLPVVTTGAALCSMHAVLLKIYRDEEKRISTDFFGAMKSNLKNGTILWGMYLGYLAVLAGIWAVAEHLLADRAVYILFGLLLAAIIGALYLDWAFILQSRYDYTVPQCLKNAAIAWLGHPGSTLVFLISGLAPVMAGFAIQAFPLIFLMGITLFQLISTTLYSRVFDEMEGVPTRLPKL